jgi:hypothetical protein
MRRGGEDVSAVDMLLFLSMLAQLSSICQKFDVKYEEKDVTIENKAIRVSMYNVICRDMFLYPSFEATITVYNPELKNTITKLFTKIQVKAFEQKKK